tara:strand:- start:5600 stop:6394 length:795 start_codon:yes stop_codon:yes gene_type:complete
MGDRPTIDEINKMDTMDTKQAELMEVQAQGQLIDKMSEELLETYVYHFNSQGRTVTSLSLAGVNDAWGWLGGFSIEEAKIEVLNNQWVATVIGKDIRRNVMKVASKTEEIRKEHGATMAMSKAEGKVKRDLLPIPLKMQLEKIYLQRLDDKEAAQMKIRLLAQINMHPYSDTLNQYIGDTFNLSTSQSLDELSIKQIEQVIKYMESNELQLAIAKKLTVIIRNKTSKNKQQLYIDTAAQRTGTTIDSLENIPVELLEKVVQSLN